MVYTYRMAKDWKALVFITSCLYLFMSFCYGTSNQLRYNFPINSLLTCRVPNPAAGPLASVPERRFRVPLQPGKSGTVWRPALSQYDTTWKFVMISVVVTSALALQSTCFGIIIVTCNYGVSYLISCDHGLAYDTFTSISRLYIRDVHFNFRAKCRSILCLHILYQLSSLALVHVEKCTAPKSKEGAIRIWLYNAKLHYDTLC